MMDTTVMRKFEFSRLLKGLCRTDVDDTYDLKVVLSLSTYLVSTLSFDLDLKHIPIGRSTPSVDVDDNGVNVTDSPTPLLSRISSRRSSPSELKDPFLCLQELNKRGHESSHTNISYNLNAGVC